MFGPNPGIRVGCLKLLGEWDCSRRSELRSVLQLAESLDDVSLDLSEVTFLDASVLGSFVRLRNRVLERNGAGRVRIVAASPFAICLLTLCELGELFGLQEASVPVMPREPRRGSVIRGITFN